MYRYLIGALLLAVAAYLLWQRHNDIAPDPEVGHAHQPDEPAANPGAMLSQQGSQLIPGPPLDPTTGLVMSADWELVRSNCIACHSPKLITQQRGSAEQWLAMIRWMQAKQNLWQFDPDTEARIIAYLADNYPPQADRRRAAIPPDLLPPNPYAAK